MAEINSSFVDWIFRSGFEGAVAAMTETRWFSSMAEFERSISAVIHSGSLVVLDMALNLATCAENRDSKFFMDSSFPRHVFHSALNALKASLTTVKASC